MRGMITGLKLSSSINNLVILYLATIQVLAHGTKHIIETIEKRGDYHFRNTCSLLLNGDTRSNKVSIFINLPIGGSLK